MDAYEILRKQAIDRREAVINEARRKCQEIIRWIDKLERQLTPPAPTKPEQKRQALCDVLVGLMPADREFTTNELYALARKAMPHRRLTATNVRSSLAHMENTDRVRRTRLVDAQIQWAGRLCNVMPLRNGMRAEDVKALQSPADLSATVHAVDDRPLQEPKASRRDASYLHGVVQFRSQA